MYREQIKVLDCTIRDGGPINNHYFTDDFVRAVYKALSKSGVDYIEFGYHSSRELFPPKEYGTWKYCDDNKIPEIVDGILNENPRTAIEYRQTEDKDKYAEFYEKMRLPQE